MSGDVSASAVGGSASTPPALSWLYVGGISGEVDGGSKIERSSFMGRARGEIVAVPSVADAVYVSGIAGALRSGSIVDCMASAVLAAVAPGTGAFASAGGIVGGITDTDDDGSITGCAAEANVAANGGRRQAIGGILGYADLEEAKVDVAGNVWYGSASHGVGDDRGTPSRPSNVGAARGTGPSILTSALPGGTAGTWWRRDILAAPSDGGFSWRASGLPKGLEIDRKSGVLKGIPEKKGTYDIEIAATDGDQSATRAYRIVIGANRGRFAIDGELPEAFVKQSYRHDLSTTGGKAVSWRFEDGTLPKGMKFDERSGRITGTPRKAGDHAFVVTAESRTGAVTSQALTLRVLDFGTPGATLEAVGVPTSDGMAEVPLTGTTTFELGNWSDADGRPVAPESLTVIVDGAAQTVSVTGGRFTLPATEDDEYELQVEATLPDGSTLKSETLYVVAGRGTLTAPDLKPSPTSAEAGETVTFDLGEWINRREIVTPEGVVWTLDGVDVTGLVQDGKLTVEAVDGGDGKMTLIVTATLPNGLTGTETATVSVSARQGHDGGSGGGCDASGLGGLALACALQGMALAASSLKGKDKR